jgi:hypothetical protein
MEMLEISFRFASYSQRMKKATIKALKYPTGEFKMPKKISEKEVQARIKVIADFPAKLKKEVDKLKGDMLEYRHRLGGWTIRQLIHHCADSHINAYVRTKLAVTEENPIVKPYDESAWANTDDAGGAPVEWSIQLLEGLHKRWVMLLSELNDDELKRTFFHPGNKTKVTLNQLIFIYSWHCNHHLAHVQQAKKYKNKFS